jgi:hypothetical protein
MVAPNRIQFVTFRNENPIDLVLLANDTLKLRRGGLACSDGKGRELLETLKLNRFRELWP